MTADEEEEARLAMELESLQIAIVIAGPGGVEVASLLHRVSVYRLVSGLYKVDFVDGEGEFEDHTFVEADDAARKFVELRRRSKIGFDFENVELRRQVKGTH